MIFLRTEHTVHEFHNKVLLLRAHDAENNKRLNICSSPENCHSIRSEWICIRAQ